MLNDFNSNCAHHVRGMKSKLFLCFSYISYAFPMVFVWFSYILLPQRNYQLLLYRSFSYAFPIFLMLFLWFSYILFPNGNYQLSLYRSCSYVFLMLSIFPLLFLWFSYILLPQGNYQLSLYFCFLYFLCFSMVFVYCVPQGNYQLSVYHSFAYAFTLLGRGETSNVYCRYLMLRISSMVSFWRFGSPMIWDLGWVVFLTSAFL